MKRPILSFLQEAEATAAIAAIRAADIEAEPGSEADKEKTVYTVYVDEPDEHKALDALEASHLESAVRCPACGSASTEFPARARASGILNAIEKAGDAIAPPAKQPFHCRSCENEWA